MLVPVVGAFEVRERISCHISGYHTADFVGNLRRWPVLVVNDDDASMVLRCKDAWVKITNVVGYEDRVRFPAIGQYVFDIVCAFEQRNRCVFSVESELM